MKIAAVSEDGVTISQHFGRAPFYVVLTIEDGKIVARETRDKMGHAQFAGEPHEESHGDDPRGHGFDPAAQNRHARMAAAGVSLDFDAQVTAVDLRNKETKDEVVTQAKNMLRADPDKYDVKKQTPVTG